jgi:uncharacterized NAD-dependent epimerase/dehydratase family protein
VLDGRPAGIPIEHDIGNAVKHAAACGHPASHLVIGLAPDGGRLGASVRADIRRAIRLGLDVDCGLHDFLTEDPELVALADTHGVTLRDVRKPPPRSELHFFSGKIEEVTSLKVAVLGTDSAVGKRTTAWLLVDAFENAGWYAELIGTGQTAWLQGARYSIILDSLVSDFMAGEIEHAAWSAWKVRSPDVLILEGQGSLMNPAYPGGFELLAAGRPDAVILQHAPARTDYDGFPGYPIQPIEHQIRAIEVVSEKPVVALTINHEGLDNTAIDRHCRQLARQTGLPVLDPLRDGAAGLVEVLDPWMRPRRAAAR